MRLSGSHYNAHTYVSVGTGILMIIGTSIAVRLLGSSLKQIRIYSADEKWREHCCTIYADITFH